MTSRREFLKLSLVGTGFFAAGAEAMRRSRAAANSIWNQFRNRWPFNSPRNPGTTILKVVKVPLTVNGRTVERGSIQQLDGTFGYTTSRDSGVDVEIINTLDVPTTVHWHGLIIPNPQDGVAFVTQPPIPPGQSQRIQYALYQDGTFWIHSHYGLQVQDFVSAPFLVLTPEQEDWADRDVTVMLRDFSFTPANQILENLTAGDHGGGTEMARKMAGFAWNQPREVLVQGWDDSRRQFQWRTERQAVKQPDIVYDALLANNRTLDDPQVIDARPGETVVLRMIAASSFVSWFIDLGDLEGTLLRTDANPVEPIEGQVFQLTTAQRLAIRVTLPDKPGVFPILAYAQRSNMRCGVILRTSEEEVYNLPSQTDQWIGRLSFEQERRLRSKTPLSPHTVDNTIPVALTGPAPQYKWSLNHKVYPYRDPFKVRRGERVEIVFTNPSPMAHPMHLHGHEFEIVEINGERLEGATRDTVMVPSGETCTIAFDANQPGIWAFHCHITYHDAHGMFNVVAYEEADLRWWQPEQVHSEDLLFR
jgi:FtsP/CotA-like multicopper oxidase with cupredoxin domain|tara:strand:- start:4734 stop:6332 length:1599 start_codon:yes stop_codon:yes gene_type:complete